MSETDIQYELPGDQGITAFVAQAEVLPLTDSLERLGRGAKVFEGGVAEAVAHCRQQPASAVMIVDISAEAHPLPAIGELVQAAGPACRVILAGERNDVNLYRSLLGEGIVDYLLRPLALDQLALVLRRAGEDLPVLNQTAGRTVAVTGASGGTGCSTVVASLALALARSGHAPQVLVDFDRRQGDLSLLLGTAPSEGLRAALEAGESDPRLLLRTLVRLNERIFLLSQQPSEEPGAILEDQALQLGAALCRLFGLSIWDLPSQRDTACMEVLRHADIRVVLCDLTVQDARRVHRLLREIGDESAGQRLLLITNASRHYGQSAVPRAQFEEFVGHKIDLMLPWAGNALPISLVKGTLSLDDAPAWREAIQNLAGMLLGRLPMSGHAHAGVLERLRTLFSRNQMSGRGA